MSRVDEARRRAAEAHAGEPEREREAAIHPSPLNAADLADLAGEPFPVERTADALETPAASSLTERFSHAAAAKVVIDQTVAPVSREQYRRLAATLHHHQCGKGLKVVMIVSAAVGEGKTLTSANLALTLSESYRRTVLLIDADLRRPSMNALFRLNGSPGLSESLSGTEDFLPALHRITPLLSVLPAGKPSSDPMAGLTSPRMRQLLDEARRAFAWVIIDTPPVGLLTDANLLASMVDGALLVVEAGVTPYDLVRRAIEAIGADRMLGVVLNRAETAPHRYGYRDYAYRYGYDYHARELDEPRTNEGS